MNEGQHNNDSVTGNPFKEWCIMYENERASAVFTEDIMHVKGLVKLFTPTPQRKLSISRWAYGRTLRTPRKEWEAFYDGQVISGDIKNCSRRFLGLPKLKVKDVPVSAKTLLRRKIRARRKRLENN